MRLVLSHDLSVSIPAALQYDADDPYAVRAVSTPWTSGRSRWFFSRDMLAQALSEHTGHGDVRMWPTSNSGRDVVRTVLSSPAGSALLEFPAQGVESFLRETWSAVPPGTDRAGSTWTPNWHLVAELLNALPGRWRPVELRAPDADGGTGPARPSTAACRVARRRMPRCAMSSAEAHASSRHSRRSAWGGFPEW